MFPNSRLISLKPVTIKISLNWHPHKRALLPFCLIHLLVQKIGLLLKEVLLYLKFYFIQLTRYFLLHLPSYLAIQLDLSLHSYHFYPKYLLNWVNYRQTYMEHKAKHHALQIPQKGESSKYFQNIIHSCNFYSYVPSCLWFHVVLEVHVVPWDPERQMINTEKGYIYLTK